MVGEIIEGFLPLKDRPNLRYFDGTAGRGGHLRAVLDSFPGIEAVAMDRDPAALEAIGKLFAPEIAKGQLRLVHGNFADFSAEKFGLFDMMLADLGVSSPQLDEAARGFSFYHEGPLDMRMDQTQELTAADVVNSWDEADLIELFRDLGEVRRPHRVAREIVHRRKSEPFTTTRQLAGLIERVDGWRKKGIHPATNYFLALRLHVNQELSLLDKGLSALQAGLKPGGRLAVLTFHSLEDRIVKNLFRHSELGKPVNKKVITPQRPEILANPRSRSAKLRIFERSLDDQTVSGEH